MILSYLKENEFLGSSKRQRVNARITTEHSTSSNGQQHGIILEDGIVLNWFSWFEFNFRTVKASEEEKEQLQQMGLIPAVTSN